MPLPDPPAPPSGASGNGKQFRTYLGFIESVKRGEKSIVVAPDYVVLSKSLYESLAGRKGAEPEGSRREADDE